MKKSILLLLALTVSSAAQAQIAAFRQGAGAVAEGYTLPRSVVTVTLTTERETILKGPYARYAAQYLGVTGAPMTDKQQARVVSASIGWYEEPDPAETYQLAKPVEQQHKAFRWLSAESRPQVNTLPELPDPVPFPDLGISPVYGDGTATSAVEKSTEQMAAEAAEAIFTLRKRRYDLVSGETGTDAFGAGMKAALKEMQRIENEYLALFLGKRTVTRTVSTFSVLPDPKKSTLILCRFSDSKGVVSDTDLSGRPITLEFTAEAAAAIDPALTAPRKGVASVAYRVPVSQVAKAMDGNTELARQRVAVYQAGPVIYVPVQL